MRYLLLAAMLSGVSVALATPAAAQPASGVTVAPRTPGGASAGATPTDQPKMDHTVDQIDRKLLNEEKDRPPLPGQAPSPSQAGSGGTAASTTSPR